MANSPAHGYRPCEAALRGLGGAEVHARGCRVWRQEHLVFPGKFADSFWMLLLFQATFGLMTPPFGGELYCPSGYEVKNMPISQSPRESKRTR